MALSRKKATTIALDPEDDRLLSRAMEVDRRFADLDLGLVDCSVVALAETLGVRRLATRDVRHFAAVRLRDGRAFDLVVHPRDADTA
jgi:predicted nucleic acid-binding protein